MKKFAAIAAIPVAMGFLFAQETTETQTTTTRNNTWSGTLVDAGCRSTHSERQVTTNNGNESTSRTETSHSVDCPVTSSTTSFGLVTPEGQYIRFDQPSNTRVIEIMKGQPMNREVRVVGSPEGDVVMVQSISPVAMQGEAARVVPSGTVVDRETMFDAKYDGDNGKLVIGANGIMWQNLEHTDRSRTWTYAEIKELKRDNDDHAIKIQAYHGGEHKFKIRGPLMNDTVYDMIAARIIAARPH